MVAYFESVAKQDELRRILEEWVGTPFRHHCGVKNLGCDCIFFAARIYEELGIVNAIKIPDYSKDWHLHNTREILKEGIIERANVEKVSISELMNGDVILSHFGKAASHVSIYMDGYIYQSLIDVGVCKIKFEDKKFKKRMRFAYRVVE